ncbi:MAG: flippase-like domain-containing protein [Pirellulaceae bacterium]|nr:flippase-like domain-containing protein [Pirellulaceae bacterium]
MKPLWKSRPIRWTAQLLALVLVVWGIAHTGRQAASQLSDQQARLEQQAAQLDQQAIESETSASDRQRLRLEADRLRDRAKHFWYAHPGWLTASGLAYALGMLPAGWFWRTCLRRLKQPAPLGKTLYAYCLGHLGKYFPGKAMVIILRVGVLAPLGVLKVATTLTIFLETLTMMAVGSALAALCLLGLRLDGRWTLLAIGLMVMTFVPTLPPLLREVLRRTQRGIEPHLMQDWLSRIDWRLLAQGWLAMTITWLANGLSLYCVLRASPSAEFTNVDWLTIGLSSLGACAMAVVLGFVSFLPGGAGVREVVLSTMLSPIVGPVAALAAAVWIRIVWLLAEVCMAMGLSLKYRRP